MTDKPDYSGIHKAEGDMLAPILDGVLAVVQAHKIEQLAEALRWALDKLMDARACGYGGVEADEISERLAALSETKEAEAGR